MLSSLPYFLCLTLNKKVIPTSHYDFDSLINPQVQPSSELAQNINYSTIDIIPNGKRNGENKTKTEREKERAKVNMGTSLM